MALMLAQPPTGAERVPSQRIGPAAPSRRRTPIGVCAVAAQAMEAKIEFTINRAPSVAAGAATVTEGVPATARLETLGPMVRPSIMLPVLQSMPVALFPMRRD